LVENLDGPRRGQADVDEQDDQQTNS
jgi:hypothetical protein